MYGVFCVLLMTGLVFLTVLELRSPRKWLTVTEGILCGTGILLHPVLTAVLRGFLSTYEAGFASWAWDSMAVYLQYALPAESRIPREHASAEAAETDWRAEYGIL